MVPLYDSDLLLCKYFSKAMASSRCCGLYTMKNGVIAIALFFIMVSCFWIGFSVTGVALKEMGDTDFKIYHHQTKDSEVTITIPEESFVIYLGYSAVRLIFAMILLVGAMKNRSSFILSWLCWAGVCFTLESIASFTELIAHDYDPLSTFGLKFVVSIGKVLVLWYWFNVVLVHYRAVRVSHTAGYANYQRLLESWQPPSVSASVEKTPPV